MIINLIVAKNILYYFKEIITIILALTFVIPLIGIIFGKYINCMQF
jgi:hypothetical protein